MTHINKEGLFQSDKYPSCPAGKVPLSCNDVTAQDLLWEYAQRRRIVDPEFSNDLETALRSAGYVPKENGTDIDPTIDAPEYSQRTYSHAKHPAMGLIETVQEPYSHAKHPINEDLIPAMTREALMMVGRVREMVTSEVFEWGEAIDLAEQDRSNNTLKEAAREKGRLVAGLGLALFRRLGK